MQHISFCGLLGFCSKKPCNLKIGHATGPAEICQKTAQLFNVLVLPAFLPFRPGLRSDLMQGWAEPAMGQAGVVPSDSPQMQLELQVVEGGVGLGEGDQSSSVLQTQSQRCVGHSGAGAMLR